MTSSRMLEIRARLTTAFSPTELEVIDESHLHKGHPGARDGRGHFRVTIVSESFAGLSRVQCHQKIYAAVADLMETDIHALSITALDQTPRQTSH
jgi:BolA protein